MPLNKVFLRAPKLVSTKPLLLKHSYSHQRSRTKNTTATRNIVNYFASVYCAHQFYYAFAPSSRRKMSVKLKKMAFAYFKYGRVLWDNLVKLTKLLVLIIWHHFGSAHILPPPQPLFTIIPFHPGHLRPVTIKPVGRIFEISDSNPIRGKFGKCGRSLSPQKNHCLRRSHGAKTRKMRTRKRGKCG